MVEPTQKKLRVSRCGPYIVKKTMGKGAFGKVKMAEHEETKALIALKLLNPSENDLSEVRKEVAFLKKAAHPNVTNILAFEEDGLYEKKNGKTEKKIVIAMELAEKGTLFEFVKVAASVNGKGFPETIARKYFQQMIAAIEHCHDQKVVHRDLKPENILLDSKYNVKIADFGWATLLDRKKHFTDAGTATYQAPEMASGKGYDLPPVDIFAAGIILFMMIAGHPPFRKAESSDSWYKFIAAKRSDMFWQYHNSAKEKTFGPGFYSQDLQTLLTGIYEPDPTKRYKIAQIKSSKWFNEPVADDAAILKEFAKYNEGLTAYMLEEKEERRQERLEKLKQEKTVVASGAFQGFKAYRGASEQDLDKKLDELGVNFNEYAETRFVAYGGELEQSPTTLIFAGNLNYIYKCLAVACNSVLEEFTLGKNSYKIKGQFKKNRDDEESSDIEIRILDRDAKDIYTVDLALGENGDYVDFMDFVVEKFTPELKKLIE